MTFLGRRPLGSSGIEVSELSLGSWRTYERIPRDAGIAVMRRAREVGINFLDDARYNDESGNAPMKSGYSEVVFGELFQASGWKREEVVLANKLWWEFWPTESAEAELEGSLQRMGMDYLDLAYAERPHEGQGVEQIVREIGALIVAGKLRAWGVLNWPAAQIAEAARVANEEGVPPPCAAHLAYSLVRRSPVEDQDMIDALGAARASVVASYSLDGGALTGKYSTPGTTGRMKDQLDNRDYEPALRAGDELRILAERTGARPAAMAIAFALLNPLVASVLFGATSPEQITENLGAVELQSTMDEQTVADLRRIRA
ncbi:MAG TPA: aldo/keto reductase [Candidatus Dormibacteraeota bacterium]|nr:aldo/keto reductase [Candidatus Dormibacteraeota bacterium]